MLPSEEKDEEYESVEQESELEDTGDEEEEEEETDGPFVIRHGRYILRRKEKKLVRSIETALDPDNYNPLP
jgi:hypothetical protein